MKKGPETPFNAKYDAQSNSVVVSENLGTYNSPEEALKQTGRQRYLKGFHLLGNLASLTGLGITGWATLGNISDELRPAAILAGSGLAVLFTSLATVRGRAFLNSLEEHEAVKRLVHSQNDQTLSVTKSNSELLVVQSSN